MKMNFKLALLAANLIGGLLYSTEIKIENKVPKAVSAQGWKIIATKKFDVFVKVTREAKKIESYNIKNGKTATIKNLKKGDIIQVDLTMITTIPKETFANYVTLPPLRLIQENKTAMLVIKPVAEIGEVFEGRIIAGLEPRDYKITGWEGVFELVQ